MNIEARTHNGMFFTGRVDQHGDELVVNEMDGGFVICARYANRGGHPAHPVGSFSLSTKILFYSRKDAIRSAMNDSYFGFDMTFADAEGERLHNKIQELKMKMRKMGANL